MSRTHAIDADAALDRRGGIREMLFIALPMVVSNACHTFMTFTDRLFLSRLGTEQMNAAMGGGITTFMVATFFLGLTGYTTALAAQYLGAGRKHLCSVALTQAILIAIAAYPLLLLARPLVHMGFASTGISDAQLVPQTAYFDILIYGVILMLLRSCLASYFSGIGRTGMVMISSIAAMTVNIGLNYVLIFGKLGLPAMGIRGAAYGTICGSACGLAVLVVTYLHKRNRQKFAVAASLRFDWGAMKRLLRFGYPAGLEMFLNILAFTCIIMTFHSHSRVTSTAVTVFFNWDMVSVVPLLGIQIGVTSLVGRYMGAARPDIAHRATLSGLKAGLVYSTGILMLFVFLPQQLAELFRPDRDEGIFVQALPIAVTLIRIAAIYVLVEAATIVFSGALRGAGDTFFAMALSVGLHWLLVVIQVLMLKVFRLPPQHVWMTMVLTFLLGSTLFYLRYRSGKWRQIRMVQPASEILATDHDQDFHAVDNV